MIDAPELVVPLLWGIDTDEMMKRASSVLCLIGGAA